jgi:hypothetical protein
MFSYQQIKDGSFWIILSMREGKKRGQATFLVKKVACPLFSPLPLFIQRVACHYLFYPLFSLFRMLLISLEHCLFFYYF